jgi:hypothetical protein
MFGFWNIETELLVTRKGNVVEFLWTFLRELIKIAKKDIFKAQEASYKLLRGVERLRIFW